MAIRKGYIPLSDEMRAHLRQFKEKTGLGAVPLIRYMKLHDLIPKDQNLTIKKIESWFNGNCASVKEKEYKSVINAYSCIQKNENTCAELPPVGRRVPVDAHLASKIETLFSKTVSMALLLKRTNAPKGLSAAKVSMIKNGRINTLPEQHLEHLEMLFEAFDIS